MTELLYKGVSIFLGAHLSGTHMFCAQYVCISICTTGSEEKRLLNWIASFPAVSFPQGAYHQDKKQDEEIQPL